jgi:hypothetical protein
MVGTRTTAWDLLMKKINKGESVFDRLRLTGFLSVVRLKELTV